MQFIETELFPEDVNKLLDDDEYPKLQVFMAQHPDCGAVIQETGGLRPMRWGARGNGTRSGVR
ncbi:type II toxin-antitoxin system RelE/ParE family toxin, partial [Salmonella enterica subsp. enterica serovar Infantis]